ncbi:MAG: archease [Desulfobacterales bacterium]|jgi:SHS2 domain-containing protein|nr:archease [Desulfobacterales bacterium]
MIQKKYRKDASSGVKEMIHTADLALRVRGKDLDALMRNAAAGMSALMCDAPMAASVPERRDVSVSAPDAEGLLVEWLSELAYWAESEGAVFNSFLIHSISETSLTATVSGRLSGPLKRTIKAVTYHNLAIKQTARGLEATVVFDV